MKRIIWASMLLGLAVVLMPLLFNNSGSAVEVMSDYEPTIPSPLQSTAPSAPSPVVQSYKEVADTEKTLVVLSDGVLTETTMAEYLPLAVAAEMPASFHSEALKAQAIAARTYALRKSGSAGDSFPLEALKAQAVAARTYVSYCTKHENPKHPSAEICTESGCCLACMSMDELRAAWGADFEENLSVVREAVEATQGQVLIYGGEPILASFHSSSAGYTESGSELWGEVPYLVSVASPETERDVPDFVTTVEVSTGEMMETVKLLKPEAVFCEDAKWWLGEIERDESGRVRNMNIALVKLTGQEVRTLFGLRSTAFTVEYTGSSFLFTVKGYGHGLGMSQYGANVMAKSGFSYAEILYHYYPETKLV